MLDIKNTKMHGGRVWNLLREKKIDLKEIITADVNDAYYAPSENVIDEINYWTSNIHMSPDMDCWNLKNKLSSFYNVPVENLLLGNGSSELIPNIIYSLVNRNDKVLILDPTYSEYENYIIYSKAKLEKISLKKTNNFNLELPDLLNRVDKNTKLIVLCNPNNPTGQIIPKEQIIEILNYIGPETYLMIDEAYIDFCVNNSCIDEVRNWERLIIIRTFSKAFALAGLRIGFAILGDEAKEKYSNRMKVPWHLGLLPQMAALQSLNDITYISRMINEAHNLREDLVNSINQFPLLKTIPTCTNFFLVNIEKSNFESPEFTKKLEEGDVLVRDCSSFGQSLNKFIRISVQTEKNNQRIVEKIFTILEAK